MSAKRCGILPLILALPLAVIGCAGGVANSEDPPVKRVDGGEGSPLPKKGPDQYWVKLETTKGNVIIEVNRAWSPYGADRFHELVSSGFFNDNRIFRVLPGFVAQVGVNGDPAVNAKRSQKTIPDDRFKPGDKARQSNERGFVTFAMSGSPNSRTTQFFMNSGHNASLDSMGFTPFGKIVDGLAVLDSFYDGYKEEPQESAPRIATEGNAYLDQAFPKLDSIKKATVLTKKPDLPTPKAE